MPSSGNNYLIQQLEEIDGAFTGLWSKSIKLQYGRLFINKEFRNDVFFNKLTGVTHLNDEILNGIISLFKANHTTPYVYSLNRPDLEEKLLAKNFRLYDVQHVLTKNYSVESNPSVRRVSNNESLLWSNIFCEAYDCLDWIDSVNRIVKGSIESIGYYINETESSCMALYEGDSVLGLYCLGTIPSMRGRGFAASLIGFALDEVKRRQLELLVLETYGLEGLLGFYLKLGFRKEYEKKIYTI